MYFANILAVILAWQRIKDFIYGQLQQNARTTKPNNSHCYTITCDLLVMPTAGVASLFRRGFVLQIKQEKRHQHSASATVQCTQRFCFTIYDVIKTRDREYVCITSTTSTHFTLLFKGEEQNGGIFWPLLATLPRPPPAPRPSRLRTSKLNPVPVHLETCGQLSPRPPPIFSGFTLPSSW